MEQGSLSNEVSGKPQSKAELIEDIRRARAQLEEAIAGWSEEQMTRRGAEGWSIKDHLAHLVRWQREMLGDIRGVPRFSGLGLDEETHGSDDIDKLNAAMQDLDRDQPLAAVLDDYRRTFDELLSVLGKLPEERLWENAFAGDSRTLLEDIIDNSSGHDREHLPWMRALVGLIIG